VDPDHEASPDQLGSRDPEPARRQRDPALEFAVGNLEPAHPLPRPADRQRSVAANDEHARLFPDLDPIARHARHGDDDHELALVLEDVDRRLPGRRRPLDRGDAEELALQAIGLAEQRARLGPHPGIGTGRHESGGAAAGRRVGAEGRGKRHGRRHRQPSTVRRATRRRRVALGNRRAGQLLVGGAEDRARRSPGKQLHRHRPEPP
jgi:hypothetical protein